jgi:hypothetical protein
MTPPHQGKEATMIKCQAEELEHQTKARAEKVDSKLDSFVHSTFFQNVSKHIVSLLIHTQQYF